MVKAIEYTSLNSVHIDNVITEKIYVEKDMALTLTQKKLIFYLVSLIQMEDQDLKEVTISFSDFFRLMKMEYAGRYKEQLEKTILHICSKCFFLPSSDGKYKIACRWLDKAEIDYEHSELHLKLDETLKPYLIDLSKKARTIFQLGYVLQFKHKYTPDVYLFASRCKNLNVPYAMPIEQAYCRFGNLRYKNYTDFYRFILKKAVDEINEKSDLKIIVRPIRDKKNRTTHVGFLVFKKSGIALEQANIWKKNLPQVKGINDKIKEAFEDDFLVEAVTSGSIDPEDPDELANFDWEHYKERYNKYILNDK